MLYDEEHKAVTAYRRAMDGKTHQLDDSPFLVYGNGRVLQLCELWMSIMVTRGSSGQIVNMSGRHTRKVIEAQRLQRECVETGQEYQVGWDTMVVQGSSRVLYISGECIQRADSVAKVVARDT